MALRVAGGYTILFIVFMLVLALYFGAVWDPQTKDLRVLIINKDGGFTVPGTNNTGLSTVPDSATVKAL